jgi:soluble lytic murein transglycosylase-like protein
MNDAITNRIFFPWIIISACILSLILYWFAGDLFSSKIAFAANENDQQNAIQISPSQLKIPEPIHSCEVSSLYPESIRQWCPLITLHAKQNNLDPDLIAALIWQESGGNPAAYSHSGAVGLMQIMPRDGIAATFRCPNGPCFSDRPTIQELQSPEFNVQYGTKFLAKLVSRRGNLREALKSYGPMDVGYTYADKVLSIYKTYGD